MACMGCGGGEGGPGGWLMKVDVETHTNESIRLVGGVGACR